VANDTVTLAVSGEVGLEDFAAVVKDFAALIGALSDEVAGSDSQLEWIAEYFDAGSATLTFVGQAPDEQAVDRVVRAYGEVGRSLAAGEPVPYSPKVETAAKRITSVLDGKITAVRFETPAETATVLSPSTPQGAGKLLHAFGAVEGRVQTLSSRGGLRFVLYDALFGRAVYCYLQAGREELMRGAWDKRAFVEGWVSREPTTGRPVSIRDVTSIDLLGEVEPGSYRRARGAVPLGDDAPLPEETIRELRDAS
jgi:hypothetical protein